MNIKNILVALFLSLISLTAYAEKELTKEEINNLSFNEQKQYCSKEISGKTLQAVLEERGFFTLKGNKKYSLEKYKHYIKQLQNLSQCTIFAIDIGVVHSIITKERVEELTHEDVFRRREKIKKIVKLVEKDIAELQAQKSGDSTVVSK